MGDLKGAEQEIRTALSLEPDPTGTVHPFSDELHHSLGELLARRGDIDGAEQEMSLSLTTPDDEDQAHPPRPPRKHDETGENLYYKALADEKAGHNEQAVGEMSKGLDMMRRSPMPEDGPIAMLYIDLAVLYDSMGNQEQVEAVLKEMDSMTEGELAVGLARARIRARHSDKAGEEKILLDLSKRYPSSLGSDSVGGYGTRQETV